LSHCRNPLSYFLARWENGPRGGFRFGLTHGAYCVGCCWAVMATGFAMGVMNMLWMALLTVLMCVEKLAPHGDRIGAAAAVGLMVWGVVLLVFGALMLALAWKDGRTAAAAEAAGSATK